MHICDFLLIPLSTEYADASTQACPLLSTFEPSYSHKDTPILTPVDWSAVPGKSSIVISEMLCHGLSFTLVFLLQ